MGDSQVFFDTVCLALNSRDCTSGSPYGGPCTFTLQPQGLKSVVNIRIKQFHTENSLYNVESGTNNRANPWDLQLFFTGDVAGDFNFTIPEGCYGIDDLLAAIDAGFLAMGDITISSYSTVTQKITITLQAGSLDSTLIADMFHASQLGKTYCMNRIGFTTSVGPSAAITADQAYVLQLTDSLLLKSGTFSSFRNLASGQDGATTISRDQVIYQVAVIANSWDDIYNQIPSAWFSLKGIGDLQTIDFNLTDDQGYPVTLHQKGYSIMMELQVSKGN